ncbi:MAG TPA: hypothetical protein PKD53_17005 [Chloroflexaceae bacterium]|nr:hypothetical protein [Chloroflexaceae bacterium]
MDQMQATSQFQAAYSSARRAAFFDAIRRRAADLPTLEATCGDLGRYRQAPRGVQTIALAQIAGSEGRAHEFDRNFLPRATYLKERWSRVAQAMSDGVRLPPIQVYKLGEHYYVCDGNHRVSVARHRGQDQIEANVTELLPAGA